MSEFWFHPKRHGYGAYPTNWKGWAATLGFAVLLVGWSLGVFGVTRRASVPWSDWAMWLGGVALLTAGFIALSKRKTDGAWMWRGWDRKE